MQIYIRQQDNYLFLWCPLFQSSISYTPTSCYCKLQNFWGKNSYDLIGLLIMYVVVCYVPKTTYSFFPVEVFKKRHLELKVIGKTFAIYWKSMKNRKFLVIYGILHYSTHDYQFNINSLASKIIQLLYWIYWQ